MKKLPLICPSCSHTLKVKNLICESCETEVSGLFSLPALSQLKIEDQEFILDFVKFSGRLKDMASKMNLSYPTVRNKLDEIIERIIQNEEPEKDQ